MTMADQRTGNSRFLDCRAKAMNVPVDSPLKALANASCESVANIKALLINTRESLLMGVVASRRIWSRTSDVPWIITYLDVNMVLPSHLHFPLATGEHGLDWRNDRQCRVYTA